MSEKPAKEDKEYWDNVLHDHGLGMNRGRRTWLIYGHEDREKDEADDSGGDDGA